MKKFIAITLALVMITALFAGCEASGNDDKKVLKVAMSPDFSPMEFVDTNGNFVGFDVFLAQYIADEMDMELEILPMSFDACLLAVTSGTVDMSISGFSWKEDRAQNYNLSDYYWAGDNEDEQIIVTLAGNEGKYTKPEDFEGVKVGAQIASLQETLCNEQLPGAEIVPVGDLTTGLLQLRNGDFEALAVAGGNADAIIASNPDIIKSGFMFEVDEKYTGNVILMQKGADELTATVNELLAKAEAAGMYDTWYNEAKEIAGVEVSYDDEGNKIDPDADAEGDTAGEETTGE